MTYGSFKVRHEERKLIDTHTKRQREVAMIKQNREYFQNIVRQKERKPIDTQTKETEREVAMSKQNREYLQNSLINDRIL